MRVLTFGKLPEQFFPTFLSCIHTFHLLLSLSHTHLLFAGVASLSRLCADVVATEGRDVSTYNFPPHSHAYRLIDRAIQTRANSKPIMKEHFF